ncbi:MAG: VWA domain-containing protein [Acidobacteria bacterium]|nr:VWA domain-containing protein [Acidobacteriota bacterium]
MKRTVLNPIFGACVSLAGLISTASAQSGRPSPKLDPPAAPAQITARENDQGFSESVPSRRPRRSFTPPLSGGKNDGDRPRAAKAPTANGSVIKVETELVTVPVSVLDRQGLYVTGLERSDFTIFEDGIEQKIAYFGASEKPFTVILLLDTSLSTNYKIEQIREAAAAFVGQLRSQDTVGVIEFDGNIHVLAEPTSDRQRIYRAIAKADFGYGTSLYDSVYYTLRKKLGKVSGRKAVVLFTDGVDTTSDDAGYDTTLAFAEESDTVIFPIYYNTFDWKKSQSGSNSILMDTLGTTPEEYALGRKYLLELAEYTGGRIFRAGPAADSLSAAFRGISEELRRQYNLGYIPDKTGTLGQRKEIRVRVNRPDLVIRARDSYIVGSGRKP